MNKKSIFFLKHQGQYSISLLRNAPPPGVFYINLIPITEISPIFTHVLHKSIQIVCVRNKRADVWCLRRTYLQHDQPKAPIDFPRFPSKKWKRHAWFADRLDCDWKLGDSLNFRLFSGRPNASWIWMGPNEMVTILACIFKMQLTLILTPIGLRPGIIVYFNVEKFMVGSWPYIISGCLPVSARSYVGIMHAEWYVRTPARRIIKANLFMGCLFISCFIHCLMDFGTFIVALVGPNLCGSPFIVYTFMYYDSIDLFDDRWISRWNDPCCSKTIVLSKSWFILFSYLEFSENLFSVKIGHGQILLDIRSRAFRFLELLNPGIAGWIFVNSRDLGISGG